MTAPRLLAVAALLAAAGWIGWTYRSSWRSADRLEQRLQRMETALANPAPSSGAAAGDHQQLETAVAFQLRTAHQGAEALGRIQERLDALAASVAVPAAPPPSPPTAEQLAAASAARALMARGVEQGRWTEDSRREMGRFLNEMDHDARDELARALVAAVNAGKLTPEGPIL